MIKLNKSLLKWVGFILGGIVSFYFYCHIQERTSVHNLFEKSFIRSAQKNEKKLYEERAERDPSFSRHYVIPTSGVDLDIIIPLVEKDLQVASYTLKSIRTMVGHKIGNIYIIAPESQAIRSFAQEQGCFFVLEDDVLPSPQIKRYGGWLVQQFLKLNGDTIAQNDHYLVVDADTIFIRPLVFINKKGEYLINTHWDCSVDRKKFTSQLLGNKKVFQYDFVCHHMLFSKKVLGEMKKHIENRFQKRWDQALLDVFEQEKDMYRYFSEYDVYATYLTEFSDEKYCFISNANITIYRNFINRLEQIMAVYGAQYKSISLHHFVLFGGSGV